MGLYPLEPTPPLGETHWYGLESSLVLVFGPDHRLVRHNLVPMKVTLPQPS
jgi:hypothetical protein